MHIQRHGESSDQARGIASAAVAATLFGTAYIGTAFALRSFTPIGAAMWRGLLSSAILTIAVVAMGHRFRRSDVNWPRLWRVTVLGLTGGLGFVVSMNLPPFRWPVPHWLHSQHRCRPYSRRCSPRCCPRRSIVARIGRRLCSRNRGHGISLHTNAGDVGPGVLFGLCASLCFGLFLLLSRRWSRAYRLSGTAIALSIAATTWLGLLPVELLAEPGRLIPQQFRWDASIGLLWLALVPGVLAQLLVVASVRRIPTRSSAAMLLISPVTAAVMAAYLLGETMGTWEIAGATMVLIGVVGAAALERASMN